MIKLLLFALLSPVVWANQVDSYNFRIWLDSREIGEHRFEISRSEQQLTVVSRARMEVKVLFVSVFKYEHAADESWQGSCLRSIKSSTQVQGDQYSLLGSAKPNGFVVEAGDDLSSPNVENIEQECVASYAYWDRSKLGAGMLINSQTGALSSASLEYLGWRELPRMKQMANLYLLTTEEAEIRLWYDQSDNWIGLQTETRGRTLTYLNEGLR